MADRFRTPKMAKEWSNIPGASVDVSGFGTFVGGNLAVSVPGTVIRMLGEYTITSRATLAALDSALVAVAIGFVSTDAATVGAASMPDPNSEPEFPWLYWASHPLSSTGAGSDNSDQTNGISVRKSFDVRSMRKFKPGRSLIVVIEAIDTAGNMPITVTLGATRVLIAT